MVSYVYDYSQKQREKTNRDTARIHFKLNELRYTLCYDDSIQKLSISISITVYLLGALINSC
jgi:hypothetical protein